MTDAAKIARGLTKACKAALIDARVTSGSRPRIVCNKLYPPTISALERRGLVDFTLNLTDDGLAVRAELERNSHE